MGVQRMCKRCEVREWAPQIVSGPTGQIVKIEQCLLGGLEEGLLKIAAADRRYKWYDRHELGVWWLPEIVPS